MKNPDSRFFFQRHFVMRNFYFVFLNTLEFSYTPTYADRTTQHDGRACVASNDSSTSTMSPTHLCTCSYTTTYDCLPQKAKVWCQHLIRARPTYSVVYMCRVATPRLLALTLARGSGPAWPWLLAMAPAPGPAPEPWRWLLALAAKCH